VRIAAVVQARLSSQRLPGKVLQLVGGTPLIGLLLEGVTRCRRLDTVVIATSTDPSDDPLDSFAKSAGIGCFRGSLNNVGERMLGAAASVGADAFVRLNGDSPLLDPSLVDRAVDLFLEGPADIVTNVWPRSFPKGQSVEVISLAALTRTVPLMGLEDREHVTMHFYSHADRYVIRSFTADRPRPEVKLSVDEPADLRRCTAIVRLLGRPHWEAGWEECVRASDELAAEGEGTWPA